MNMLDKVLARAGVCRAESRARWFELLRIPSVSADPGHVADVARAGEWVAERLRAGGMFAAAAEIGDDADPQTRLLALTGRRA
jgi:acetylornithine deacetylase/succinyl-diaminopimelate desuccinylase-like protein